MNTAAYYGIAFENHHIMNPISEAALLDIARPFVRKHEPALLDIGSGKGYPALSFAREFGARCTLIDSWPRWNDIARELFSSSGMSDLLTRQETSVEALNFDEAAWDVILCLGTTPVFGDLRTALGVMRKAIRPDGLFIIGEATIEPPLPRPYQAWIRSQGWDIPDARRLVRVIGAMDLEILHCRRSTTEEWDCYMSAQWASIAGHAARHPSDPEAQSFLSWMRKERDMHISHQRRHMQWNVLAASPRRSGF